MIGLLTVLGCVTLIILTGGSLSQLARSRLPYEGLLLVLFVAQGLIRGRFVSSAATVEGVFIGWAVICLLIAVILWPSRHVTGVSILMGGLASNLLVVLANAGMPYQSPTGMSALHGGSFYHLATSATHLLSMGDVLPSPDGRLLLSLGDLLLMVGAVSYALDRSKLPRETGLESPEA